MGKFSGYLMVSDLDKTFFAEGTDIPPRNIEAVKYFIENGGKFTLATGRGAVAAKIIAAERSRDTLQRRDALRYGKGRSYRATRSEYSRYGFSYARDNRKISRHDACRF